MGAPAGPGRFGGAAGGLAPPDGLRGVGLTGTALPPVPARLPPNPAGLMTPGGGGSPPGGPPEGAGG